MRGAQARVPCVRERELVERTCAHARLPIVYGKSSAVHARTRRRDGGRLQYSDYPSRACTSADTLAVVHDASVHDALISAELAVLETAVIVGRRGSRGGGRRGCWRGLGAGVVTAERPRGIDTALMPSAN